LETLVGKVALVTGASSGIGRATALALSAKGAVVYATARRPGSLAGLEAEGLRGLWLDVTDEESMVEAVRRVEAELGAVDVLVNNAGYGLNGPAEELGMDNVRREFETNVFGLLRMGQLVLPGMRGRGYGRIVNVGSVGGTFVAPGAGAYHASKYAVEAFSDALRMEVGAFGVDVVLVQPTGVHTPFAAKINATVPETGPESPYAAFKENMARATERMFSGGGYGIVEAEDVAAVIVRAAGARRPRARYKVGTSAYVYSWMRRLLTDRAWDALMARQFPMTRPAGEAVPPSAGTSPS
jgi:NAD(P)-dependent dehydrogenase (short-subunit alcohol dehydrogenase family)